jgi:hypothetical protein
MGTASVCEGRIVSADDTSSREWMETIHFHAYDCGGATHAGDSTRGLQWPASESQWPAIPQSDASHCLMPGIASQPDSLFRSVVETAVEDGWRRHSFRRESRSPR